MLLTDRPAPAAAITAFFIALIGIEAFDRLLALLGERGLAFGRTPAYMVSIGMQCVFFAVPALLYCRANPRTLPAMRIRRMDPLCAGMLALAALVGMLAFNWVSFLWVRALDWMGLVTDTGQAETPQTLWQLGWMLAAAALAPAFFEEALFRGFLLPSMEPFGRRRAMWISGVMFALLHGRIEALPTHLILGAMLAWLTLETDCLPYAILYHAAYNAAILVAAYGTARARPEALGMATSLGESLRSLPAVIILLGVWTALLIAAMRRGRRKRRDWLPPATRVPMPMTARGMLVASFVLLGLVQARALMRMLPGAGP